MIRPFISSFGRLTEVTVTSVVTSVARRWIVVMRTSRARRSLVSWDSCSILLMMAWASCLASFSRVWMMSFFASSAVRPEIFSNSLA